MSAPRPERRRGTIVDGEVTLASRHLPAQLGDGDAPQVEVPCLTVGKALEGAFGCSAPASTIRVFALSGVPSFHRRLLLIVGLIKASLAFGIFLPLFTHAPYQPPDCTASREEWPLPARGSIAFEWGLVCGDAWQLAAVNSAFFAGCMMGASVGGIFTDYIGRMRVTIAGTILHAIALAISSIAPDVTTYGLARFASGVACIATLGASYTLLVEWVPEGWRPALSGVLFCTTAIGEATLVFVALLTAHLSTTDWSELTRICALLCCLPAVIAFSSLPESPQWLLSHGMKRTAFAVLHAAVVDSDHKSQPLDADLVDDLSKASPSCAENHVDHAQSEKVGTRGALTRILRLPSTYVMLLLWFTASFTFYGISLSAGVLSKGMNLYASATLSAFSEIPSCLLMAWMLDQPQLGRRLSATILFGVGGTFCAILPLAPAEFIPYLAILGKFCLTAVFNSLYVYASELFETAARGSALGLCSSAARFGSILAPQAIALLTSNQIMVVFGITSLVAATSCRLVLHETRARTFSEEGQVVELEDVGDGELLLPTDSNLVEAELEPLRQGMSLGKPEESVPTAV